VDSRITLLEEFYRGLPKDRAKVETQEHGFAFLDRLLADGATLEYGELTLAGLLHKYKLAGLPAARFQDLLCAHVAKTCNLCLYFGDRANELFCFNLDNNHKTGNTEVRPEMELAVRVLSERLRDLGCAPLVVASGRGFHLWGRLEAPVENARLYGFMLRCAVATAAALHGQGHDHHRIKFNFYPDPRSCAIVSLRLFGTEHAKNKVFSRVLTPHGLLDEAASWAHFADTVRAGPIAAATFDAACETLAASD
jgi:hypothetical protein